jgi:hypothetical protein
MAKIKEVELDGEKFKIGKFNCLQVEEMVDQPPTEDQKVMTGRMWSLIATALSNGRDERVIADSQIASSASLIEGGASLKALLSLDQRNELHRELLEFNGLSVKPAGESQGTGAQ